MTKDTAKFVLSVCKPKKFFIDCTKQYDEAVNMAQNALDKAEKYEKVIEEVKRKIDVELELWTRMDANEAKNAFAVAFTLLKNYIEGATR